MPRIIEGKEMNLIGDRLRVLNSVIFPLQSINLLTYCAETLTIDK